MSNSPSILGIWSAFSSIVTRATTMVHHWHVAVFLLGLVLISPIPHWFAALFSRAASPSRPYIARDTTHPAAKHAPQTESHLSSVNDESGPADAESPTNAPHAVTEETVSVQDNGDDGSHSEDDQPTDRHGVTTGHKAHPSERGITEGILVLLEKLGEALIIAVILALFVDDAVKHALVKEVVRDVLDFAVGFQLPEEVKEQVKYILRLPFVRRGFEIRYVIEPFDELEASTRIRLYSFTRYQVINLTDSPKKYTFRSAVQIASDCTVEPSRLLKMEVPRLGLRLEGAQLVAQTDKSKNYLVASVVIEVPEESAESLECRTERVEHHHADDTIVLDILEPPCIGITLIVDAPKEFEVSVSFGTPRGEIRHTQNSTRTQWTHTGVHLPGSHFRMSWKRIAQRGIDRSAEISPTRECDTPLAQPADAH